MDADTIRMKGISPMVTYFCERPVRLAGHLTVKGFLSSVTTGTDSFAGDPPNAVVSILSGGDMVDVVVTLPKIPKFDGDQLVYKDIEIIEGELPEAGGEGSLFIDIIGW
jgi:hypothetical protein